MIRRARGVAWALFLMTTMVRLAAQGQGATLPDQAEREAQLRFLASDELAGRMTGTPGNAAAARFVAETLRSYGVSKPEGWADYLQPVPLERVGQPSPLELAIAGRPLRPLEDFLVVSGGPVEFRGAGTTAGYGRVTPEIDDYAGVEAGGKAVLVRFGLPGERPSPRQLSAKNQAATQKGAAVLLEFYEGPGWDRLIRFLGGSRVRLKGSEEESPDGPPHVLVRQSDTMRFDDLVGQGPFEVELKLGPRSEEDVDSANVVGVVAGANPDLRSECVVVSAHYDHLGSGGNQPGATANDKIFNGARDNAMGVVALLAAAKRVAARPPARSVVFLATTGEEQGLLGSAHYVQHPVFPLEKTIFALNADGAGFNDTATATVLGLDRTAAKETIVEASARAGLEAIPGPEEAASLFERSDNVNFARRGVPTVTYSPGFRSLDGEGMRHYHLPSDEAGDDFDFAYLTRFAEAFADVAAAIANLPQAPRWSSGDPFEAAAEKLYRPR